MTPEERTREINYLRAQDCRTLLMTARLLMMRIAADGLKDDARVQIAYSEPGVFRRVVEDSLSGYELKRMVAAILALDASITMTDARFEEINTLASRGVEFRPPGAARAMHELIAETRRMRALMEPEK